MNLLDLNVDIKRLILDHLSQSDLLRICLTHSHLYQVAQPVLYSSIILPSRLTLKRLHPIISLVRSILTRPELARHIRRLSCPQYDSFPGPNEQYTRQNVLNARRLQVPPSDAEAAVQFVQNCEVPFRDSWIKALQSEGPSFDAYLAVLLVNLPGLVELSIEPSSLPEEKDLVKQILRSLLCDRPPSLTLPEGHPGTLQVLRNLSLEKYRYSRIPNTPNMLLFFYLPSVKRMCVCMDDPAGGAEAEFPWPSGGGNPPRLPNLQFLEVKELSEAHLGNILSLTPSVTSLTYTRKAFVEAAYDPEPLTLGPVINLHRLQLSLDFIKDTLTRLEIRIDVQCGGDRLYPDNNGTWLTFQGPLNTLSLSAFKHLKILELPIEFIMGFPALPTLQANLPPNVEELTLSTEASYYFWTEGEYYASAEQPYLAGIWGWLADAKRLWTPKIRKFTYFDFHEPEAEGPLSSEHRAARVGIHKIAMGMGIMYRHFTWSLDGSTADYRAVVVSSTNGSTCTCLFRSVGTQGGKEEKEDKDED